MNRKYINILVFGIIGLVIILIVMDFISKSPDKRGANPYEYNVDDYKAVDKSLIHYKETGNIPLNELKATAIDLYDGNIYLCGENFLQEISPRGVKMLSVEIEGIPECIKVTDENIILGFEKSLSLFNKTGQEIRSWELPPQKTVVTSIAAKSDFIYVADAGNRRVLRYSLKGELLGMFEGKRDSNAGHGFIVPSPNFDLVVNSYGELWVVNPGEHSIENYTDEGEIRGYWTKSSMAIEGFTGCCNPAEIAVLEDGSFITSEKGMVRIKVYDASGEMISVVAAPDKFMEEGHAPEVVADSAGIIYALDFDRNTIRIFEKKESF
jgi:hypothetical protein